MAGSKGKSEHRGGASGRRPGLSVRAAELGLRPGRAGDFASIVSGLGEPARASVTLAAALGTAIWEAWVAEQDEPEPGLPPAQA